MKKIVTLILLISSLMYGKTLELTPKDIEKIEASQHKKAILKRFDNYEKLKVKIKGYSLIRKLSHINTFYNKILPQHDTQKYGISDYWSTRKEFLIDGRGDCEDYVIAKYLSLLELGFSKEKLFLSIVNVKGREGDHMVLFYFKDRKSIPYVLDNLSFKVLPLDRRKKIDVKVAFNQEEAYLIRNHKLAKKVKIDWGKDKKWERLLKRIYKNNE